LRLTPTARLDIQVSRATGVRRWWLVGCVEGDQALGQTGNAATESEALEQAEAWLAPELDAMDVEEQ